MQKNNSQFSTINSLLKIAIAGTGYAGLSNGSLWTQDDEVVALASPDPSISIFYRLPLNAKNNMLKILQREIHEK